MQAKEEKLWNPYFAGIALGLVLLTSFVVMGKGLGASGASYRLGVAALAAVAPDHVAGNGFMHGLSADGASPLSDFMVFLAAGVFVGGLVSSFAAGRMGRRVIRGPRLGVGPRLAFALAGGILMGWAARLTRGCASGQGLTGGAMMSVGGWIFMMSFFAGGYALAYFLRRVWT